MYIDHTVCDFMSSMNLAITVEALIILGSLITQSKASFDAISPKTRLQARSNLSMIVQHSYTLPLLECVVRGTILPQQSKPELDSSSEDHSSKLYPCIYETK